MFQWCLTLYSASWLTWMNEWMALIFDGIKLHSQCCMYKQEVKFHDEEESEWSSSSWSSPGGGGGFDSCKICSVLEPECHEDQTCAYVAQMQSISHTQNVASTAPLQCTLASNVFPSDLHKLSGFWHSHPACFQDLAQTAAHSSERLPRRTLLHLAPL